MKFITTVSRPIRISRSGNFDDRIFAADRLRTRRTNALAAAIGRERIGEPRTVGRTRSQSRWMRTRHVGTVDRRQSLI